MLPLGCLALAGGCKPAHDRLDPPAGAQAMLIVDTHIDLPYRLLGEYEDVSQRTVKGDFDFDRAKEGGLGVAFMSIFVPADQQAPGLAKAHAERSMALVEQLVAEHPEQFALVADSHQARQAAAAGKVALPMGMENAAGVEDKLDNVAYFHRRGIRYMTLVHGKANLVCDSSYDPERPWGGLSPYGRELVKEMNRVGVMVDVSHVSDAAFEQVMEVARAPVIASHSSARAFTPGFERNMSDDMIRRLADSGGVIQVNFGSPFLTPDANRWFSEFIGAREAYREEHGLGDSAEELKQFELDYREKVPFPYATLGDLLAHIDHIVGLVGVDHVGIGSDFEGVGDSLPLGVKDVSGYPNLVQGLRDRGYSEEDIRKIMGENLMRVWAEVEAYAARIRESAT